MAGNATAWCSWCFKKTTHKLLERNYVRRNVYQCENCLNRTLFCRFCDEAMARGHESWDDEKCAKCDELVTQWGYMPNLSKEGWCSWCFEKTKHRLVQQNSLRRDVYECESCTRRTLPCRACSDAFSRGHATWDDEDCAKCDGTVKDWTEMERNQSLTQLEGWCSWCLHKTNHTLEQKNTMSRDTYVCEECGQRTLACRKCHEAMTCGGPGWDDEWCAKCKGRVENWYLSQRKVDAALAANREPTEVRKLLASDSQYKTLAMEMGTIRPFLLLVSMDAAGRNEVACRLGWSLFTQDYFGDVHRESWEIISADMRGLQARSHESYERLNPLARNSNWYEILQRTSKEIFQQCDASNLTHDDSLRRCQDSRDTLLPNIEEDMLNKIALLQMKHMSQAQMADLDEFMQSQEVRDLAQQMQKAGIKNKDVIRYAINTVYQALRAGGFNSYIMTVKIAAAMNRYLGTRIVMSQATKGVARFAAALNIIGWLWLAADLTHFAFGSSLGRAFPAVIQILNQRLFLATDGISVEEFY